MQTQIKNLVAALSTHNIFDMMAFTRDIQSITRFYFISAALESGLLESLRTPSTLEELSQRLEVKRPELLEALLQSGLALGELACENGVYRIKGRHSRAVMGEQGDMWAALVQAGAGYYHSVYQNCADRMKGAPLGHYLENIGELVARLAKIDEPFNRRWLATLIAGKGAIRILDIGCGSGIYLKRAFEANSSTSGIGIDLDPAVVQQAKQNLAQWDIAEHFKVIAADIRVPPAELTGPFDVITLINILYYFPVAERCALFRSLRERLASTGALAMVCTMRGRGVDLLSANLNIATSSMVGCTPLPDVDETVDQLKASGFRQVEANRLIPGISTFGILAR